VVVRDQNPGKPWVPRVIEKLQGPVTYLVRLDTGQLWKRHIDHLKEINGSSTETVPKTTETEMINAPLPIVPNNDTDNNAAQETLSSSQSVPQDSTGTSNNIADLTPPNESPQRRYPLRTRKPNPRYTN